MSGRGEKVEPVQGFPPCGIALANPGKVLATEAVYAALQAQKVRAGPSSATPPPDVRGSFDALLAYALPRGNDLEAPAAHLVPAIGEVLAALRLLEGARLARLSGSGPTCFALFRSEAEARRAASGLASAHPAWWVASGALEP